VAVERRLVGGAFCFLARVFPSSALKERSRYGYELTRRIAGLGFGATRPEKKYRALRQMEREGMVVSEYDGTDPRLGRRKYSIAESGEVYLEHWAGSLGRFREEVDLFHRLYAGELAPGAGGPRTTPA
jgi:PadR family transcriptional regulator, regulatory protein PadR